MDKIDYISNVMSQGDVINKRCYTRTVQKKRKEKSLNVSLTSVLRQQDIVSYF